MYSPRLIILAFAAAAVAQLATDEIPPVTGLSSDTTDDISTTLLSDAGDDASVTTSVDVGDAIYTTLSSAVDDPVYNSITAAIASLSSASDYPAGSTLPDGGYVCNPAHSYGPNESCDISAPTPTLVTLSVASSDSMTTTTSTPSGGISYPGTMTNNIAMWTGAASAETIPMMGLLAVGAAGYFF